MKGFLTIASLLLLLLAGCADNGGNTGEFNVRQLQEKEDVLPKQGNVALRAAQTATQENQQETNRPVTEKDPVDLELGNTLPSENRRQLDEKIKQLRQDLEQRPETKIGDPKQNRPSRSGTEKEKVTPRPPGGILRVSAPVNQQTLAFGERLDCRLAGELVVSQFDSFCVIDIYKGGRKVGFGFGQGSFIVNDRVDVQVHKIAVDGKLYSGQFQAITLDGSVGLQGKVDRKLGKIIFQGLLSTLATGLAVKNPGDGLSSLLQANLANRSLDSLSSAIDGQRYYKTVTIPRQTPFQLISIGSNREVVDGQTPTDNFKNAFQEAMANEANQGALKAYMRNLDAQARRQRP